MITQETHQLTFLSIVKYYLLFCIAICFTACGNQTCACYFDRIELLLKDKKYERVIKYCSKTISYCPDSIHAYYIRSTANYNTGNLNQALNDINKVIKMDSDYQHARTTRGIIYRESKEFEKALEDFSREVEKCPTESIAFLERSKLYVEMGYMELALQDVNRILAKDATNVESLLQRARIYMLLKNNSMGTRDLRKVEKIMAQEDFNHIKKTEKNHKKSSFLKDFRRLISSLLRVL